MNTVNRPQMLARETHTIDRAAEFFSEDELAKSIGQARAWWAPAILKELVDNGLDAAEGERRAPEVRVVVEPGRLSVEDNGPGIPAEVVTGSFDYATRTTDKAIYVSPTRGRQGNALKTVWAVPFVVAGGDRGEAAVEARGVRHEVVVAADALAGRPVVRSDQRPSELVTGSRFSLTWAGVAEELQIGGRGEVPAERVTDEDEGLTRGMRSADVLLRAYSLFNPHASFRLAGCDGWVKEFPARSPGWEKWRPDAAVPAHWYTRDQFTDLLAALARLDHQKGRRSRSIRELVTTFKGLSGTAKPARVRASAALTAQTVADLFPAGRPDRAQLERLRRAMCDHSRNVSPGDLGVIGEASMVAGLRSLFGADEAVGYKKVAGHAGDIPFVLEAAFGVSSRDAGSRCAVAGVNWSPALRLPFEGLADILQDCRVDEDDPVVLAVHLAFPGASSTDRGKSRYDLPPAIRTGLEKAVSVLARGWKKEKADWAKFDNKVAKEALDRHRKGKQTGRQQIIAAANAVMPEAYAHASGGVGAMARQIMYSARSLIIERYGLGSVWKDSKYFTQTILPAFLRAHPELTANWDVRFDDRGHFLEPHTGRRVGIGTVNVRDYIVGWGRTDPADQMGSFVLPHAFPTGGPRNRFRNVLFVEKEGFHDLLQRARVQERYDIALMSTKGMSVIAARRLVESLTADGVTIYVMHDFDKSGLGILHTLRTSTDRYEFRTRPNVKDLGLRLADVQRLGLTPEGVEYTMSQKDPREKLGEYGATREEQAYLVHHPRVSRTSWKGQRVELNAMTSPQVILYVEHKLAAYGVAKFVPDGATLTTAYLRAARTAAIEAAVAEVILAANRAPVLVPEELAASVASCQRENPELPWDEAVYRIARGQAGL